MNTKEFVMRKLFSYLSLLCMTILLGACSKGFVPQKGDVKFIVEMDKTGIAPENVDAALDSTENILRSRLDNANLCIYFMERIKEDKTRLLVYARMNQEDDIIRLRRLLFAKSQLEFWETYNSVELYPALQSICPALKSIIANSSLEPKEDANTALDGLNEFDRAIMEHEHQIQEEFAACGLVLLSMTNSPVVGIAGVKDTAIVNQVLHSDYAQQVLSSLPYKVRFAWGARIVNSYYGSKQDVLELYALKVTDPSGRAPLDGSIIFNAKSEIDYSYRPTVMITMNASGAYSWECLTRKNIQRAIAIVIDDYVYCAPIVMSEIMGGKAQITGNFSPEDVDDLANVLNNGKLPAGVRIISEEVVK